MEDVDMMGYRNRFYAVTLDGNTVTVETLYTGAIINITPAMPYWLAYEIHDLRQHVESLGGNVELLD